jgi:hypothetical protein
MFHQRSLLVAAALIAAMSLPAAAQQPPKMVGTWKGTGNVAHIGPTPYRAAEGTGVNLPANDIEFTYVIKDQQGNRFAGEASAGKFKETIIGAVQPDNRGGVMLDDDGQYLFTLIDPNTMDVCYNHHYPTSKAVGCFRVTRSR